MTARRESRRWRSYGGCSAWLHQPQAAAELQEAMTWAQNNPPTDRKSGAVLEKLRGKG
jgi:predicted aminopeptidase